MMEMLQRDFSPPLPCEPLADNAGRLRVKAQDLVTWIDAQVCPRVDLYHEEVAHPKVSCTTHRWLRYSAGAIMA